MFIIHDLFGSKFRTSFVALLADGENFVLICLRIYSGVDGFVDHMFDSVYGLNVLELFVYFVIS